MEKNNNCGKNIVIFDPPGNFGPMIRSLLRLNELNSSFCQDRTELRKLIDNEEVDILVLNLEKNSNDFKTIYPYLSKMSRKRIKYLIIHEKGCTFSFEEKSIACSYHVRPVEAHIILEELDNFIKPQ